MSLRLTAKFLGGRFDEAMQDLQAPIRQAGLSALKEATDEAKARLRGAAGAAGFSSRWQNTLRGDVYDNKGADPASALYSRIPYAGVFAEGATIPGDPLLWVPLPWAPKRIARKRMTPERFVQAIGPLVPMKSRSGRPLLGARVAVSKTAAKRGGPFRASAAALRRGAAGTGTIRTVPLFVGLRSVSVAQKFDADRIIRQAAARLPELYLKHLNPDG